MTTFLFDALAQGGSGEAVIRDDQVTSHETLNRLTTEAQAWLDTQNIPPGAVVSFDGDYSAPAVALFLALIQHRAIIVPLSADSQVHASEYRDIAEVEYRIIIGENGYQLEETGRRAEASLYDQLRAGGAPGLVLFSSGSTGKSKAIVQDINRLLAKFQKPGKPQRMLIFLQLDHIGGINSLFYTLANKGTLVVGSDRSPDTVARTIEKHRVELLPTSPTFLNLLILSGALKRHDLSSLRLVTYGTEPMQESTLKQMRQALPAVTLQQTYGLSEVGILRSRSRESGSLWMKVGGDEFRTRIKDGTLWVQSDSAMLGYLNAPSPFDDEGFLDTGDIVEQDGDWIRILGRRSEIINVGGSKVYPAEVESVLLEMPGVRDVVVYGEQHPITGSVVVARFQLDEDESPRMLKSRMLEFCRNRLPPYKVPSRVAVTLDAVHNERFKRMRRADPGQQAGGNT